MKRIIISILYISNLNLYAQCDANISFKHMVDGSVELSISYDKSCIASINQENNKIKLILKSSTQTINKAFKESEGIDNNLIDNIISSAKSKLGYPYSPSHAGPNSFDCSGFVYYVFGKNGIKIPRTSRSQALISTPLNRQELKRGDIVVFDTAHRGHINHSGIYLGDGNFIHATSGRAYSVTISNLDRGFYKDKFRWGVRVIKNEQINESCY